MSTPRRYEGTIDEHRVDDLIVEFGELVTEAEEVGFILTYHSVDKPDTDGRMDLAGRGISQRQLEILLRRALAHNAEHGSTT